MVMSDNLTTRWSSICLWWHFTDDPSLGPGQSALGSNNPFAELVTIGLKQINTGRRSANYSQMVRKGPDGPCLRSIWSTVLERETTSSYRISYHTLLEICLFKTHSLRRISMHFIEVSFIVW
jgi:hypothetical protein